MKALSDPPSEIEIASICNIASDETLTDEGKMIIRRLAFERDRLRGTQPTEGELRRIGAIQTRINAMKARHGSWFWSSECIDESTHDVAFLLDMLAKRGIQHEP